MRLRVRIPAPRQIMGKKFAKNKEDFMCTNCGYSNIGNGYTNHCSNCLWSLHVDINPGDRLSTCKGKMMPIKIEGSTGSNNYRIIHKCILCGYEKPNRVAEGDNIEAILNIVKENADKLLTK